MLSDRLRKLREDRNLQPKDIAELLGMTRQGYCRYEDGKSDLSTATLSKLADFYGVTTDYLLERDTQKLTKDVTAMTDNELDRALVQSYMSMSEDDKQGIRNYILEIFKKISELETPPQIVQTQNSVEEPKREQVPYVARDLSGKNTKGFIDISDEDLAKAEVEDYSKYD